jgi:phosphotransferase system IIB component
MGSETEGILTVKITIVEVTYCVTRLRAVVY